MSKFNFKINDYRLCEVNEGGNVRRALFHMWTKEETPFIKMNAHVRPERLDSIKNTIFNDHIVPPNHDITMHTNLVALVEFEDGSIAKVKPETVRFLDADERFREYCVFDDNRVEVVYCPRCGADHTIRNLDDMKMIISEFGEYTCTCKSCKIPFALTEKMVNWL